MRPLLPLGDTAGLTEFDLNSPEDEPKLFGPYPVNRAVQGLKVCLCTRKLGLRRG